MLNNTVPSNNEKTFSAGKTHELKGLCRDKIESLLLGIGAFLILFNVIVFFGLDTKPNTWLHYLNMRFWAVHVFIVLWIAALWAISETTDLVEDYLPAIRYAATISALFIIIFALVDNHSRYFPWLQIIGGVTACCVVRSFVILYHYQYGGESTQLDEEEKWFLGVSAFIFSILAIIGIMYVIPVRTPLEGNPEQFFSSPLLTECQNQLRVLLRNGSGSLVLRLFSFMIFTGSIVFACTIGKWILFLWLKMRGE